MTVERAGVKQAYRRTHHRIHTYISLRLMLYVWIEGTRVKLPASQFLEVVRISVDNAVSENTRRTYQAAQGHWQRFVFIIGRDDDPWLLQESDEEIEILLIGFMHWYKTGQLFEEIFSTDVGRSQSSFTTVMAGVRHFFVSSGASHLASLLNSEVVAKARKGVGRMVSDRTIPDGNAKLPITADFLDLIWADIPTFPDNPTEWKRFMIALGTSFCYNFVWRVSNLTDETTVHGLRCSDVTIVVSDNGVVTTVPFPWVDIDWDAEVNIYLCQMTNKTSQQHEHISTLTSREGRDAFLIGHIRSWITAAHWSSHQDLFFCLRYQSDHNGKEYVKSLRRVDVATVVKDAASALGLDPSLYSTQSCRKGGSTTMYLNNASIEDIQHQAGWTRQSPMFSRYVRMHNSTPGALASTQTEQVHQSQLLLMQNTRLNRGRTRPSVSTSRNPSQVQGGQAA